MVRCTDRPAMTIAVDLGRKATNKQTNKTTFVYSIFNWPLKTGFTVIIDSFFCHIIYALHFTGMIFLLGLLNFLICNITGKISVLPVHKFSVNKQVNQRL